MLNGNMRIIRELKLSLILITKYKGENFCGGLGEAGLGTEGVFKVSFFYVE